MRHLIVVGWLCSLGLSSHVYGVVAAYSSRAAFNTAAGALTTESFDSHPAAMGVFNNATYDFGDFTAHQGYYAAGGGDIIAPGTVNGTTEIYAVVSLHAQEFLLTFESPISALGFDAFNLADQRNDDLIFNNSAGDIVAIFDPIDQTRFWGFISDTPFTTMTIRLTGWGAGGGSNDGFRIDDMTYSTIPAAPSVGLLIAACAMANRRRA